MSVEGPLTFETAGECARTLNDAINSYDTIAVDLADCTSIDLAGAQVLISSVKTARQHNVTLRYRNAERYRLICEYAGLKAKGLADS